MQAQPDPEWSFASIAADAETVNDLTVGLDEIAGVTMPSPLPRAEGEVVLVALGMTPSLPLGSEDAEKDVVLLDEVDDLDPTLVLAAPFAALLPDPALSHVNTETIPKDAPWILNLHCPCKTPRARRMTWTKSWRRLGQT
jgi:hypothetical protein